MPGIIADIYMADRYVTSDYKMVLMADTARIYEAVFSKYGYTSKQFTKTIDFYITRPTKLKEFYTKAKAILEEQEKEISSFLDMKSLEEKKSASFKKIIDRAGEIILYNKSERALRWILVPERYPSFNISAGDSLSEIFETPLMAKWWINNFKQDTTKFTMILKNEKNRSTIHIPSEFTESGPKRDGDLR
ncbi:MAG: hypothetical protein A2X19_05775 [Bacteroidetes bacterium GWE2_39_28]|nr:MAG: hypothetical protein A2X19_05775 [Bacteroidetes bacterium GWE2_39_28]OFY15150.1 MAG: hypothetical protein A2X16_08320 [Bacteroidetes bacterium GWF2_39_10]OFZ10984.1 MAG: hypothetical protein A2465_00585 [Bacteroidetes bacterium RIFOXYC2_FULL_39_11]